MWMQNSFDELLFRAKRGKRDCAKMKLNGDLPLRLFGNGQQPGGDEVEYGKVVGPLKTYV